MAGQAPKRLREVLTPLADRYGLDYGEEAIGTGRDGPEATAYRFLAAGAWLLVLYVEPDDVPADSRRTRRRVAKRLARNFPMEGAQRAVILLTHAMGIYVAENMRRAGETDSADGHLALVELVADQYPLAAAEQAELTVAYDRLRRRETALDALTPGFRPGDEAAEGRTWAADDLYRGAVTREAFRLALGSEEFAAVAGQLTLARPDASYDGLVRMRQDARWWSDAAQNWSEAAQRALS